MEDRMAWERIFAKGEYVEREIHPEMEGYSQLFKSKGVHRILDLGCGMGRHSVFLAREGFDVVGVDIAPTGLRELRDALEKRLIFGSLAFGNMEDLPFRDQVFDAVIAIQVIHHNRLARIQQTVSEIRRVLRLGGLVWATVTIHKIWSSKQHLEVEPGTFIPLDGPERGLPHHYFTKEGLRELFHTFSILDLHIDEVNHHSILARKAQI